MMASMLYYTFSIICTNANATGEQRRHRSIYHPPYVFHLATNFLSLKTSLFLRNQLLQTVVESL